MSNLQTEPTHNKYNGHCITHTKTVLLPRLRHIAPSDDFSHTTTPCSTALFEKLTGPQIVNKFPAFYGTRRFIATFTSARHLPLSWATSILSIPLHPTSWRSILILFSHLRLGLPTGFFPSGFPTKTLYTPLLSPQMRWLFPELSLICSKF